MSQTLSNIEIMFGRGAILMISLDMMAFIEHFIIPLPTWEFVKSLQLKGNYQIFIIVMSFTWQYPHWLLHSLLA